GSLQVTEPCSEAWVVDPAPLLDHRGEIPGQHDAPEGHEAEDRQERGHAFTATAINAPMRNSAIPIITSSAVANCRSDVSSLRGSWKSRSSSIQRVLRDRRS